MQGAYVSDEEISSVVGFTKDQAEPTYTEGVTAAKAGEAGGRSRSTPRSVTTSTSCCRPPS